MDVPTSLLRTRAGTIWAPGGHQNTAAIAEFDGEIWTRQTLPGTSTRVRPHVFHQSFEGDLWLGPDVGWEEVTGKGGIVQIHDVDGGTIPYRWTQHIPWESTSAYAIGETRDGVLWFGVGRLRRFDSQRWSQVSTPRGVTSWVHAILPTSVGDLWIGTRTYGAFQRTGDQWRQHSIDDGLISNLVQHLLETADGTIWAATGEGVHRYDGRSWQQYRAPMDGSLGWLGGLRQTAEGAVWLNQEAAGKYRTIRYLADRQEPETEITWRRFRGKAIPW
ncbi:MAG: two-component regulator propeller domain-containing protein [Candidatus Latescibacterota bacterium]